MATPKHIEISLKRQEMACFEQNRLILRFVVSTAAAGAGCRMGSGCTPTGRHIIRAKIGAGLDPYAVLVGRRPTGEVWTPQLQAMHPGRDWILGRILWLSGCEVGHNRLGQVDTMRRYIYIHGAAPTAPMGVPRSCGCVRMRCEDVVRLFDWAHVGTRVEIMP
ncbi:MAG TPA: L,D-transpeptidase [Piscirickettsiaceae bacterium]|nr:L,D-transpeptidase [Piscirickettsiaceae bacterium]HIQ41046.1 L,D-transpeptidase [Sulfurivirga caldicuralii]